MRNRRQSAFTLIELLVVVAIIALLIALLLPALSKAKEVTRRVNCAANLHALGQGYHVYMTEYQDYLPIGINGSGMVNNTWAKDVRDSSYIIYSQKPGGSPAGGVCGFKGLGMPAAIGALTGNGPYFCPSALLNMPQFRAGSATNPIFPLILSPRPWDGGGALYTVSSGVATVVRNTQAVATYSVRGTIPIGESMRPGGTVYYHIVAQSTAYVKGDPRYYDESTGWPPGYAYDADFGGVAGQSVSMPKATSMRANMVIASDYVCGGAYIDLVHKDGVNGLRMDGSAGWLARGIIEPYLSTKPTQWNGGAWGAVDYSGPGDGEGNTQANFKTVWDRMDQN